MEIYAVSFQGIPTIAFSGEDELRAYFKAQKLTLEEVYEMRESATPNWEVNKIDLQGPDYKKAFEAMLHYWDALDKSQKECLNRRLKALGC